MGAPDLFSAALRAIEKALKTKSDTDVDACIRAVREWRESVEKGAPKCDSSKSAA